MRKVLIMPLNCLQGSQRCNEEGKQVISDTKMDMDARKKGKK
jgi:hypothetical protein